MKAFSCRRGFAPAVLAAALLFFLAAAMLPGCAREEPETVAGGWSNTETGTGLTGQALGEDGKAAQGARILLRPADYLANDTLDKDALGGSPSGGSIRDALTDSNGTFTFEAIRSGDYALEAQVEKGSGSLTRLSVAGSGEAMSASLNPTRPTGSLTGRARFSDGSFGSILVRIYGLERAVVTDPEGRFAFGSLPAGEYVLRFSSPDPFAIPVDRGGIRVEPGSASDAGEVILERTQRQSFGQEGGFLELPGVDSTNPVILENGTFINPLDGAYLWAKASMGHLDLRGTIVSFGADTGAANLAANLLNCSRLIRLARYSGMRDIPDPISGSEFKLGAAPSGNRTLPRPIANAGTDLLIREARRASREKPLLVFCGANMTTVASALLLEPGLADHMVVFGAHNATSNAGDSLALAVVAKQARLVEWGREYNWSNAASLYRAPSAYIANGFGQLVARHASFDTTEPLWAHAFYGDFGPATFLFRRQVWKGAQAVEYAGSPLAARPASGRAFDFVDIPAESNDWASIQSEFLATLNHPAAYHAWPLEAGLEAESYAKAAEVKYDTNHQDASEETAHWTKAGAWAEFQVTTESGGTYAVEIRHRNLSDASAAICAPETSLGINLPATGASTWGTVRGTLRLGPGARTLRVECVKGSFHIDHIGFRKL